MLGNEMNFLASLHFLTHWCTWGKDDNK